MYRVLKLYDVMVRQYPHLSVQWKDTTDEEDDPTDDLDDEEFTARQKMRKTMVDEKEKSEFFHHIFLMKDVPLMIQFVLYHQRAMRTSWGLRTPTSQRRLVVYILGFALHVVSAGQRRAKIQAGMGAWVLYCIRVINQKCR